MKEKLKKANYKYEKYLGNKSHLLRNLDTGKLEIFFSNKRHASWGLIWKNTHLEFLCSVTSIAKTIGLQIEIDKIFPKIEKKVIEM